jgi:hypothetical protein
MNSNKIQNVLSMAGKERYEYFVRKVSDFQQVWGLFDEGWATTMDDDGQKGIVLWPENEFASLCATDKWSSYKAKEIDLDSFLEKWLLGMEKDGINAIVFSTPDAKGVFVKPTVLLNKINDELKQYK